MGKLLLLLALASCTSCTSLQRFAVAPPRAARHYHHCQRVHERERRRQVNHQANVPWSKW